MIALPDADFALKSHLKVLEKSSFKNQITYSLQCILGYL